MISVITLQITKQMRLLLFGPTIYPVIGSFVANSDYSLVKKKQKKKDVFTYILLFLQFRKKKKMFSRTSVVTEGHYLKHGCTLIYLILLLFYNIALIKKKYLSLQMDQNMVFLYRVGYPSFFFFFWRGWEAKLDR